MEEVEVESLRHGQVAEVALVDFAFGEERAETVAAGRILAAEEFKLADGVVEGFLVLEDAAFFGEDVSDGGHGGIGAGRGGIAVVDGAVGFEDVLVLEASALLLGAAFEGFAEAFGVGEGGEIGPRSIARLGGTRRAEQNAMKRTQARAALGRGDNVGDRTARCIDGRGGRVSGVRSAGAVCVLPRTLLIIGAGQRAGRGLAQ